MNTHVRLGETRRLPDAVRTRTRSWLRRALEGRSRSRSALAHHTVESPTRPEPTRVLSYPDGSRTNPYQRLLAEALVPCGFRVIGQVPDESRLPLLVAVRRARADVLHLHWLDGLIVHRRMSFMLLKFARCWFELSLLKLAGIPVVWSIHNQVSHESPHPVLERRLLGWVMRKADYAIAHCENARRDALRSYRVPRSRAARLTVIPLGGFGSYYKRSGVTRRAARQLFNVPTTATCLLSFGTVRDYKGIVEFVGAFQRTAPPTWHLIVAGGAAPPIAQALGMASADDPRVHLYLDVIPEDAVCMFFKAADVVVLPYQRIYASTVALLALDFARPVLSTRAGCLPEVLAADGTEWIEDLDPDSLRRSFGRLEERSLFRMARSSRMQAESFAWPALASRVADVYRQALS